MENGYQTAGAGNANILRFRASSSTIARFVMQNLGGGGLSSDTTLISHSTTPARCDRRRIVPSDVKIAVARGDAEGTTRPPRQKEVARPSLPLSMCTSFAVVGRWGGRCDQQFLMMSQILLSWVPWILRILRKGRGGLWPCITS